MSDKTMSKEDYLNKAKDLGSAEAPKQLDTTDFFTIAEERRSVRQYDPSHKMEESEIRELLETAIQAPSSSNLQPWRFLVIQDQAAKEELLPIAFNQQQIVDASIVVAILGDTDAYKKAGEIYGNLVEMGRMPKDMADTYINSIHQTYGGFTDEKRKNVAMIDGGLVAMQLMLAAKAKGLDTVPMGGFKEDEFKATFNIPEGVEPVMLLSVGKGAKAGFDKNRLPLDDVLQWDKY
ncbi:NAD(P)H nitroreductase [Pontibacillus halophilus JSM 076056 = DSM 19796]|uniref:NAD(P)H nitroreductase n=1 Tax=Pontibacillus halophilus JSM 076056 = DSM 19796 TaxID=1385510 RepID=A0A0A5GG74_9BACI|nr:nitroreductase family protein [Pontibacillus halophilus]KGX92251.1 NAD(P)H nitroreductase [Pontibacillus halophilus JSM 076056 = DSM 19796]